MSLLSLPAELFDSLFIAILSTPPHLLLLAFLALAALAFLTFYLGLHAVAPKPRPVLPSEKTYRTTDPTGAVVTRQLPCWYDRWLSQRQLSEKAHIGDVSGPAGLDGARIPDTGSIEPAELAMSVVVPAYNEELRMLPALQEMVDYLDTRFGRPGQDNAKASVAAKPSSRPGTPNRHANKHRMPDGEDVTGYEIIIVNDGSKDKTVDVALEFTRKNNLHDIIRIVTLEKNRGKGGAVTHGFRHVRGRYAAFADADGASKFSYLGNLVSGCNEVLDGANRGVAIGSRGHLVGSDAVVKRSALRNFLMKAFHFVLMILTPPATSRLSDTQCGFKLFSRAALPHIIPYMHSEGWIFDIEMLMLAESAPASLVLDDEGAAIGRSPGIRVAEVPIDWHEVEGSKLNVLQDSIKMALGLTILRASWMFGVYRRRMI